VTYNSSLSYVLHVPPIQYTIYYDNAVLHVCSKSSLCNFRHLSLISSFLDPNTPLYTQSSNAFSPLYIRDKILHNLNFNYNQQDATILIYLFLKRSTCFRRFLRPPSVAHNCNTTSGTVNCSSISAMIPASSNTG